MSVIKLKNNKENFKGGLLVENPVYKPFRYPWCYDAWLTQQRIHWLPEEVPLGDDVRDWQKNLSQSEKNLLTQIFRFFTQADVEVSNCYLRHYTTVFKPTEVLMIMTAFELDQKWIVELGADRTPHISQAQSINLFLQADVHKKELHQIHFDACKKGLKSLNYCRTKSIQRAENINDAKSTDITANVYKSKNQQTNEEPEYEECLSCQ